MSETKRDNHIQCTNLADNACPNPAVGHPKYSPEFHWCMECSSDYRAKAREGEFIFFGENEPGTGKLTPKARYAPWFEAIPK